MSYSNQGDAFVSISYMLYALYNIYVYIKVYEISLFLC